MCPVAYRRVLIQMHGTKMDGYPSTEPPEYSKAPAAVQALLDAGADSKAQDDVGRIAWDLVPDQSPLKGTDVYRQLNVIAPASESKSKAVLVSDALTSQTATGMSRRQ